MERFERTPAEMIEFARAQMADPDEGVSERGIAVRLLAISILEVR
jgi:hypothetical protein